MATAPKVEAPASKRGQKGSGTTIGIELKEYPEILKEIREKAKADDREASKFLRRIIVQLHKDGKLFA